MAAGGPRKGYAAIEEFWQNVDMKNTIPEEILQSKDCVQVKEGVKDVLGAKLYYREALPLSDDRRQKTQPLSDSKRPISVLLLHGQMFSSKTWLDLGTIHILAAMGVHTVAIDIPGYGNTPAAVISDKASFPMHVIRAFDMKNPVIVSPSMSGYFTLPHLLKYWEGIAGYIPVAPVGIEVLEELPTNKDLEIKKRIYAPLQEFLYDPIPDLSHIKTPTMVVFGEKDRSRSSALLSLLPVSQCQEIPNGSHPAYLDNPTLWHQLLYNFLRALEKLPYTNTF